MRAAGQYALSLDVVRNASQGRAFQSEDSFKPRLPGTPSQSFPILAIGLSCTRTGLCRGPIRLRETMGREGYTVYCTALAVSALNTAVLFLHPSRGMHNFWGAC